MEAAAGKPGSDRRADQRRKNRRRGDQPIGCCPGLVRYRHAESHPQPDECPGCRNGGRIDAVVFCPHGPDQHCACRKPRTGMLLALARRFGVSLRGVPVVGDSLRDLEAALSVDAIPILVRSGKGEITAKQLPESLSGIKIVDDLKAAVDYILQQVDL